MTFGRRVDGPSGRRKSVREEVVLAASAVALNASLPVVVTDVSPKGAKLLGRNLPAQAANVLVSVGKVELFATVAWSNRDECGIAFEAPIDKREIDYLKREGRWAKVMGLPHP